MRIERPRNLLTVVVCALLPALVASACGGNEFTRGADLAAGGTGATGATSGTAGGTTGATANGGGTSIGAPCDGPEDCDDKDPCTIDHCNAEGTCDASPKCAGTEQCCNGECGECCADKDCDDKVDCTQNTCFSRQCMYVPDDSQCAVTHYCSTKDGCRLKQACGLVEGEDTAVVCDDDSPCTKDTCSGNFCKHDFCVERSEEGGLCCPDKGCAKECCTDSQCDRDDDPCTVGSCNPDGSCSQVPLCSAGQQCCTSADGSAATCGACCSAEDCDDKIGCTVDKCGGGQCSHTPMRELCDDGYLCTARGCQKAPACDGPSDCIPGACQSNPSCVSGQCEFDGCPAGSKCCGASCGICCDAAECADLVACTIDSCGPNGCSHSADDSQCPGQVCDAQLGCVDCADDADCNDDVACTKDTCNRETRKCSHVSTCALGKYCNQTTGSCVGCLDDSDCAGAIAYIVTPGGCSKAQCVDGICQNQPVTCTGKMICCAPYGCTLPSSCNVIETQ